MRIHEAARTTAEHPGAPIWTTGSYDASLRPFYWAATNPGSHQAALLMMANWVYGIEILRPGELIKKIAGETPSIVASHGSSG